MHATPRHPTRTLISLANAQGGCLTRGQCLAAGLSAEQTRVLARGWVTLARGVYGWADVVGRPCDVAARIAAVPHRKGWSGRLARCPRCRTASAA